MDFLKQLLSKENQKAIKNVFEKGKKLDLLNEKKYKNWNLKKLEKELENLKQNMHLMDDFEGAQSKAIVLQNLIKQKKEK